MYVLTYNSACMSDERTVAKSQAALGDVVFELLGIQERLEAIDRWLPVPNLDAMLAGDIAPDLATEVSGRIECIAEDLLRRVESLQGAACLTAHELERDSRRDRRRREAH